MCAVMALDAPAHQVTLEAVGAPALLDGFLDQPAQASSKFRGLCWDRKHQSWRCRIFYASKVSACAQEQSAVDTRLLAAGPSGPREPGNKLRTILKRVYSCGNQFWCLTGPRLHCGARERRSSRCLALRGVFQLLEAPLMAVGAHMTPPHVQMARCHAKRGSAALGLPTPQERY